LLQESNNPLEESWLRKAQAEHPADFWLNYDLAIVCRGKNPVESAGYCRVAIAVRPGSAAAYNSLGNALKADGKRDEASAAYRKAIALARHTRAHRNLGSILMEEKGKLEDALASIRTAIEVDPKDADAHNLLGLTLKRQNKPDEAADAYRKAIAIDPENALAHYNLGNLLYTQKKLDAAVDSYRTSITFDPKNIHAHQSMGNALRDLNKLDEAIACYRICLKLDPKSTRAHDGLGFTLGKKGWQLANHPDPKLRDPKRAIEFAREAVAIAPHRALAWQRLGWVQYRAGNWKASIEALQKSCELEKGGDAFQWFFQAMAHWQLGERDEARKWHERAVLWMEKNKPSQEELRPFRAEADALLGLKGQRE
jgi:tetratricopeptide (TPR) repeat protein